MNHRTKIPRLWNGRTIVIPLVTGALGNIRSELAGYLNKLPGNYRPAPLLKAAFLDSAHSLHKILDLLVEFPDQGSQLTDKPREESMLLLIPLLIKQVNRH